MTHFTDSVLTFTIFILARGQVCHLEEISDLSTIANVSSEVKKLIPTADLWILVLTLPMLGAIRRDMGPRVRILPMAWSSMLVFQLQNRVKKDWGLSPTSSSTWELEIPHVRCMFLCDFHRRQHFHWPSQHTAKYGWPFYGAGKTHTTEVP